MIAVYIAGVAQSRKPGEKYHMYVRTSDKSREKHSHRSLICTDLLGNHVDEELLPYNLKQSPLPHYLASMTNIRCSKNSPQQQSSGRLRLITICAVYFIVQQNKRRCPPIHRRIFAKTTDFGLETV